MGLRELLRFLTSHGGMCIMSRHRRRDRFRNRLRDPRVRAAARDVARITGADDYLTELAVRHLDKVTGGRGKTAVRALRAAYRHYRRY